MFAVDRLIDIGFIVKKEVVEEEIIREFVIINNVSGYLVYSPALNFVIFATKNGENIFKIQGRNRDFFNQILSTFKFIE